MKKIIIKELQAKPFEVKETVKNIKQTILLNKTLLHASIEEAETDDIETVDAQLDSAFELFDSIANYLSIVLKLNEKQIDKLEDDIEQDRVMEIANQVASELMGAEQGGDDNQAPLA